MLDRRANIDSIRSLSDAFAPIPVRGDAKEIAFGIDSSVFLRLAKPNATETVDVLTGGLSGPLILPSQAVLEFWNNHPAYVDDVGKRISKNANSLLDSVKDLGSDVIGFRDRIESLVAEFKEEFGYVMDAKVSQDLHALFRLLLSQAELSTVPRVMFRELAAVRKATRTPPGFLDAGDGDFFIWVEFLYGLLLAQRKGRSFQTAVLLTEDQKMDWSRGGVPHPLLAAEVRELLGVHLEIWTIKRLQEFLG